MGCIHSKLDDSHRRRRAIRKSAISNPRLISSPLSIYSFDSDEKRVVPLPPPSLQKNGKKVKDIGKARADEDLESRSSVESDSTSTSSSSVSPAATSQTTPKILILPASPGQGDDGEEGQRQEYLTQAEITLITTRITKFVSSLTSYGQLMERSHLELQADLAAILNLLPLSPPPMPICERGGEEDGDGKGVEVVKISLLSSHRPMNLSNRLTTSKSTLASMRMLGESGSGSGSVAGSPSCVKSAPIPSTSPTKNAFKQTPHYLSLSPSPTLLARTHLLSLQNSLSKTYASQKSTFAAKYWPLISVLPRYWITFSKMRLREQEEDVRRHLRRPKGEACAKDGMLLGLIRGLSFLATNSEGGENVGERGFDLFEEEVGREFDGILRLLKGIEREMRERSEELGVEVGGGRENGREKKEGGSEWSSAAMKWRVFGLVLKERGGLIGERRGEILRERVGLSAILLRVFEDVREGGGGGEI